jgi:DNA-binding IscR family transcriptional regulator
MRIATRFSIAVHILSILGSDLTAEPTSEFMAGSIGVNPVVVRNVTGMLRRAGLVESSQGKAGAFLAKPLASITLLDVYRAVEADTELFAMHRNPHPQCPVGHGIQGALETEFSEAQRAMEHRLAATTMDQIVAHILSAT